jgi:NAD(P)H-hydrate repair Nnr-like enzyme with NAD(P)H-hydrate epimerase domain
MVLVTSAQIRKIEQYTIDEVGIPAIVLMENAGRAIEEEVMKISVGIDEKTKPWLILIGKGNSTAVLAILRPRQRFEQVPA